MVIFNILCGTDDLLSVPLAYWGCGDPRRYEHRNQYPVCGYLEINKLKSHIKEFPFLFFPW